MVNDALPFLCARVFFEFVQVGSGLDYDCIL